MENNTTLEKPLIKRYYQQYLNNHKNLNMEFGEWMASKLDITEHEAVVVIKEFKNNLINKQK